jgi:hypothetical protein
MRVGKFVCNFLADYCKSLVCSDADGGAAHKKAITQYGIV